MKVKIDVYLLRPFKKEKLISNWYHLLMLLYDMQFFCFRKEEQKLFDIKPNLFLLIPFFHSLLLINRDKN